MDHNHAIGQSRSLLWVAQHMQNLLNTEGNQLDPNALQITGYFLSSTILRALAAEVALKALYSQETGKEPERIHNLLRLFRKLHHTTRNSLDHRFQRIQKLRNISRDQSNPIEQVLAEHKDDFVVWRYILYQGGDRHIKLLNLEPVVEAIIEEYSDNHHQQ